MTRKEIKKLTIKNLRLLRDYIDTQVTDEQFDMKYFRTNDKKNKGLEYYSKDNCGTVGCALGWAPLVKGLEPVDSDFDYIIDVEQSSLDFHEYSYRVFPELMASQAYNCYSWQFVFSTEWNDVDNTRQGFIKRVNYLLEKDLKLEDFDATDDDFGDFVEGWTA